MAFFWTKLGRFLQVTTFWLQRVAQSYYLRNFSMKMCSLAHFLFNESIFIEIGRELAWLWRYKLSIEIKRKQILFAHFFRSFVHIIRKWYHIVIRYDTKHILRILIKKILENWFFFSMLKVIYSFCCLGSLISSTMNEEIGTHIAKAGSSFGRLQERVWKNKYLTMKTKVNILSSRHVSSALCYRQAKPGPSMQSRNGGVLETSLVSSGKTVSQMSMCLKELDWTPSKRSWLSGVCDD